MGQQVWVPATAADVRGDYRLAFGQGVLDLRRVTPTAARDIHVTLGAGQVRVLLPAAMNATVQANVRLGDVSLDGTDPFGGDDGGSGEQRSGIGTVRTVLPPDGAAGAPVTIHVDVANGNITIVRSGDE